MVPQILNSAKAAASGCCDTLGNVGAATGNWLSTTAQSVVSAVTPFFSYIAQGFSKVFSGIVECGKFAFNGVAALPVEVKVAIGVSLLLGSAAAALYKYRAEPQSVSHPTA